MKRPRELRGPENHCGCLLWRLLRSATARIAVATTTATAAFARTLVEFFAAPATSTRTLVLALLRAPATHLGLLAAAHNTHAAALLGVRGTGAIAGSKCDLEFIEFIPLGIGPIAVGDGQQLLHALAG